MEDEGQLMMNRSTIIRILLREFFDVPSGNFYDHLMQKIVEEERFHPDTYGVTNGTDRYPVTYTQRPYALDEYSAYAVILTHKGMELFDDAVKYVMQVERDRMRIAQTGRNALAHASNTAQMVAMLPETFQKVVQEGLKNPVDISEVDSQLVKQLQQLPICEEFFEIFRKYQLKKLLLGQ